MFIVFLMLGTFALVFAQLVRQSDERSARPTDFRCGDGAGTVCLTQRMQ
jgi:hypothetical protein